MKLCNVVALIGDEFQCVYIFEEFFVFITVRFNIISAITVTLLYGVVEENCYLYYSRV